MDLVSALYNQVDEEVHKLVILSNRTLQQLENLLEEHSIHEQHQEVGDVTSHINSSVICLLVVYAHVFLHVPNLSSG